MVGIVDYGVGNLFSLNSSVKAVGSDCLISSSVEKLRKCDRLILPGVGSFGAAMNKLAVAGLDSFIKEFARVGGKVLGVCLGMQLLFERSFEFGETKGLGLIGGDVVSLSAALAKIGSDCKVPQIGWNSLRLHRSHALTDEIQQGDFVYYVHSYYAPLGEYTVASSDYGVSVTGIASCGNVAGCQFHPEKSGDVGLRILKAFALR